MGKKKKAKRGSGQLGNHSLKTPDSRPFSLYGVAAPLRSLVTYASPLQGSTGCFGVTNQLRWSLAQD